MAETVIVGDDDGDEAPTVVESAHEAAVAEGASAVQAEAAETAADEAKAAAEVALQAAQVNVETATGVAEATASAEASAAQATVSAEMVMDALNAQGAAIASLAEELKASRKQAVPAEKASRPAPDQAPAKSSKHWYYGG